MVNAIHNERVKRVALALSNTGVAAATIGVVTPVAAVLYGTAPLNAALFSVTSALLVAGITFHVAAQFTLGKLKDV